MTDVFAENQDQNTSILTRKVIAGKHGHFGALRPEPEHANRLEVYLLSRLHVGHARSGDGRDYIINLLLEGFSAFCLTRWQSGTCLARYARKTGAVSWVP